MINARLTGVFRIFQNCLRIYFLGFLFFFFNHFVYCLLRYNKIQGIIISELDHNRILLYTNYYYILLIIN